MLRHISALIAGLVFGLGLVISQMVNPAKVIDFLWVPYSLGSAGALLAYAPDPP